MLKRPPLSNVVVEGSVPLRQLAEEARRAARWLMPRARGEKDRALAAMARALRDGVAEVVAANRKDLERARCAGLSPAMLERLELGPDRVEQAARAVERVAALDDPVGSRSAMRRLPNGLLVGKQRMPLGVIAMIYESRPNVTVEAAALCLKAGNAVLLRGGKEAAETNQALGRCLTGALRAVGLPPALIGIVPAGDREGIRELLGLTGLVDLAIPRGGEGLVRFVAEHARVPVVLHYQGVCHLFLDEGADLSMALALTLNGKVQRPGVCNALECLLVHRAEAARLLPPLGQALHEAGVELRGCPESCALLPQARAAAPDDYGREFLDRILAVRVVQDLDAALEHVARYGSNHTEAICTPHLAHAERWVNEVDASCVLVNASTRFNDGGELGLGAEIGISTSRLHAYGPMGLEGLTTEKWVVLGTGQVRE